MIKIVDGDIRKATENIVCQQVNCMGVMGKGLAAQLRAKWPKIYISYKNIVDKHIELYNKGLARNKYLLGSIQFVEVDKAKYVANLFGQLNYGKDGKQYTDYKALRTSLQSLYSAVTDKDVVVYGYSIAIPYNLGCGLAGGDWDTVYSIIEEVFHDYDVTIYNIAGR